MASPISAARVASNAVEWVVNGGVPAPKELTIQDPLCVSGGCPVSAHVSRSRSSPSAHRPTTRIAR